MLTDVPPFFTYFFCLFCSHTVINIMEFDETVIQVRCLASYYTRFNQPKYSTLPNLNNYLPATQKNTTLFQRFIFFFCVKIPK